MILNRLFYALMVLLPLVAGAVLSRIRPAGLQMAGAGPIPQVRERDFVQQVTYNLTVDRFGMK